MHVTDLQASVLTSTTTCTCLQYRCGGAGGAIASPKIQVEEHCSPYISRVRLNTEQPKSSIDIAACSTVRY